MSFATTSAVLGSAVANAGTVTVNYPAGTNQAFFTGPNTAANTGIVIVNDNDVYLERASGVRVGISYGASNITITNNTGVTWPEAATLRIQLGRAGIDQPTLGRAGASIVPLTTSVGTASDTIPDVGAAFTQATLNNIVASLASKINELAVQVRALNGIR